ncbi:hypothetical protein JB92DRAFT_2824504 [Gautieria morchelliformis]|nr:hypothetical protein JB92DRAFT_2824504 [Gautieria morchelliformis]
MYTPIHQDFMSWHARLDAKAASALTNNIDIWKESARPTLLGLAPEHLQELQELRRKRRDGLLQILRQTNIFHCPSQWNSTPSPAQLKRWEGLKLQACRARDACPSHKPQTPNPHPGLAHRQDLDSVQRDEGRRPTNGGPRPPKTTQDHRTKLPFYPMAVALLSRRMANTSKGGGPAVGGTHRRCSHQREDTGSQETQGERGKARAHRRCHDAHTRAPPQAPARIPHTSPGFTQLPLRTTRLRDASGPAACLRTAPHTHTLDGADVRAEAAGVARVRRLCGGTPHGARQMPRHCRRENCRAHREVKPPREAAGAARAPPPPTGQGVVPPLDVDDPRVRRRHSQLTSHCKPHHMDECLWPACSDATLCAHPGYQSNVGNGNAGITGIN